MRRLAFFLAALAPLAALGACGSDEEAEVTVEPVADDPDVAAVAVDAEPQHDGTVVAVGPYPVEVVAHESGQVYAYVLEDAPAPSDVTLTVDVPVERRRSGRPVRMVWNPRRERWQGRVRRLSIVPGALDVHLTVGDVVYDGHVDVIVVAPAIEIHVETRGRRRRKHKHKHKHRKHRPRGGVEIRFH